MTHTALNTFLSKAHHLVLASALLAAGCASVPTPVSVVDTIAQDPNLSTLSGLISSAGLADALKTEGPFTVFAPTNEAFKAVPAKTMEVLSKDPAALKNTLSYHVLPAKVMAADVKTGKVKTLAASDVELSKAGEFVTIEAGLVTKADVLASNGVVHVIDTVLTPPAAKK